jgi:hypothetical protein
VDRQRFIVVLRRANNYQKHYRTCWAVVDTKWNTVRNMIDERAARERAAQWNEKEPYA